MQAITHGPKEAEFAELVERARQKAFELRRTDASSEQRVIQLEAQFERAARAALRRPHPLQRSRVVRRVIHRLVPAPLRSMIKRRMRRSLRGPYPK